MLRVSSIVPCLHVFLDSTEASTLSLESSKSGKVNNFRYFLGVEIML